MEVWRALNISSVSERITLFIRSLGITASATTRLPRVLSTLTWEVFLSVAKLDSRKNCSMPGS